jgi:intraflagellar transport protein 52
VRLAQTTNKCTDDDVSYYIQECGDILGVSNYINERDNPKAILNYVFQQIMKYKKLNQE